MPMTATLTVPTIGSANAPSSGWTAGRSSERWRLGRHGVAKIVGSVEDFGDRGADGGLVDEGLVGGERGDQGLQGEVVHRAGETAGGGVDQVDGVLGEQLVGAAGQAEVVLDVAGGL